MPEGLSAGEVGKEIGEHAKHAHADERRDRLISITEAVLLSVVALLAAWSGYAAAKWSTSRAWSSRRRRLCGSRRAEPTPTPSSCAASRPPGFDSWFVARHGRATRPPCGWRNRIPPEFKVAFVARDEAGDEPQAPRAHYMPQYKRPGAAEARILDARAKAAFLDGEKDGSTADKYVRLTVVLASILFLVGISTHFPLPRRPLRPDRAEHRPARAVARPTLAAAAASVLSAPRDRRPTSAVRCIVNHHVKC